MTTSTQLSAGQTGPEVTDLQSFLAQTGYLGATYEVGRMCKDTCRAVRLFQAHYGLQDCGGVADGATLELAGRPRCGVPDVLPGASESIAGSVPGSWLQVRQDIFDLRVSELDARHSR